MTKFLTTLEKIQADHGQTARQMGFPSNQLPIQGSAPQTPPDIIAMLLQEILDTVKRTEYFLRSTHKDRDGHTVHAKASEPIKGIEKS